jgi:Binding domain of DNA repair protein Ercc1 (rad10/Swi10).
MQNPYTSSKKSSGTSRPQHGQINVANSPQLPAQVRNTNCTFSQAFENVDSRTNNEQNNSSHVASIEERPTGKTKIQLDDLSMLQPHVLYVSTRQRGNGILRYIRNVPFSYANIVPDYLVAPNRW